LQPDPFQGPMRAFLTDRARPFYGRDRVVDIQHMTLRLKVDPTRKWIEGTVTYRVEALRPQVARWVLDAGPDLTVRRVSGGSGDLSFQHDGERLVLRWPTPLAMGQTDEVTLEYQGRPSKGLYFVGPDVHPGWPVQVWSQGEAEDNHFWFPTHDFPNERFTTEAYWTVPKPFMVIANGALVDVRDSPDGQWRTYHWKESVPHVAYLVSVVVGEFRKVEDRFGDIPVEYYVPLTFTEVDARRSFGKTPAMMAFFSERLGFRYPYAKYAQTAIYNFQYGGMENLSATTVWVETLHDERAHLETRSDGLVAHELAHHWFGNLVTCKDWTHIWLNESFATFLTAVWFEHDEGPDAYDWERLEWYDTYLQEAREYLRPIVWKVYTYPDDMFDRHSYEKGGLVLHMLRTLLGEELFWKGVQQYIRAHTYQTVETSDLRKALEEVSGMALEEFFDQWVYHAGHPKLRINSRWDPERGELVLQVEQRQDLNPWVPLFRIPTQVLIVTDARAETHDVLIHQASHEFRFPLRQKPRMVLLDPGRNWLAEQAWDKSTDEWAYQLERAESVFDRAMAARALGARGDPDAVAALANALAQEKFYGVRMEIAKALGKTQSPAAVDALVRALQDPDARVRRAAVNALGESEAVPAVALRLQALYDREPAYGVRAAIIRTLVRWEKERAWAWIHRGLQEPSHRDQIQAAALRALKDLAQVRPREVRSLLREWARPGKPLYARVAAIQTLAELDLDDEELTRFLESFTQDPVYRVRAAAIRAVGGRQHERSRAVLQRVARTEPDNRLRTTALRSIERLTAERAYREAPADVRAGLEALRRELLQRLQAIEARLQGLESKMTPARP
ncbi:MAG: M1 family aminopeptidase, partial [Acidobacteria bacterium]|nr:M1 family aminopeptidase [Acidobacteriota bacterium]MDW7984259.1 M1 family aminopeptidase [Acidobacteriota bacterium]